MNDPRSTSATIAYYNKNASSFIDETRGVDMRHIYTEFLPLIAVPGKILDAGCGSGRDSLHFKQLGYDVFAFDASTEMAALASQVLGSPVHVMTFLDISAVEEFDGIWACASLLHVSSQEINRVFLLLSKSLKRGGFLYASFKYGCTEEQQKGRFFNNFNEMKFSTLLESFPELTIYKRWQSPDARPNREKELWLNVILKKH